MILYARGPDGKFYPIPALVGPVGPQGIQGPVGPQGPQGESYVLTDADMDAIAARALEMLGGNPVWGYVEEDTKSIILHAPEGDYTYYYELEDGTLVEIGKPIEDNNTYYSVTSNLTNCVSSNSAVQAAEGESYEATITANAGYELESVVVTMGGTDISSTAVSGGTISIAEVTGDIIITAVAEEKQAAEPVTVDIALTRDISIGSSDGTDRAVTGYCATEWTDLTDIPRPCVINLTGARWVFDSDDETGYVRFYVEDVGGSKIVGGYTCPGYIPSGMSQIHDSAAKTATFTITDDSIGRVRFAGHYTWGDTDTWSSASATLTYTPES